MGQWDIMCPGLSHSQQDLVSTAAEGVGTTLGLISVEGVGEGVNVGSGGQTVSESRAPFLQFDWLLAVEGGGDGVARRRSASRARAACSGS